MATSPLPMPPPPSGALPQNDPLAAIRTLSLSAPLARQYERYRVPTDDGGFYWDYSAMQADGVPQEHMQALTSTGTSEEWSLSGLPQEFGSKYQNITELPDGRVVVRMQRPAGVLGSEAGHKYDTMDVIYRRDPGTGQYVMDGTPTPTRQTSGMQDQFHDAVDAAASFVLPAAAMYFGGQYLMGGETAAGGAGASLGGEAAGQTIAGGMAEAGAGSAAGGATTAAAGGTGMTAAEQAAFMEANAGAGAPGAGWSGAADAGAAGGGSLSSGSYTSGGTTAPAGGGSSAPTTAARGAGNMTMTDWLTLGTMAYGAYQGDQARQGAEAAAAQGAADARAARDQMAGIAGRQLDLAERQYADQQALLSRILPVFEQQMQLAIQEQQRSIERGNSAWADYEATWRPVEQRLSQRSLEMADPARIEQQAEQAGLRARGNFDTARTQMRRDMAGAGLSPDRIAAAEAASRLDEAKAVGGATDTARRGGESAAISYLDNAARFGRNLPSQGLETARLAGAQGSQAMGAAGAQQGAVAAPAQIVAPLLQGAAGTMGNSAQIGLQGAQLAQRGFNDSLAFYGDLIGAGASLWGMNSRPRGG